MTATGTNILDLPLELFQAILAAAIRVRGLKRGFRLRLVSRFFSTQVIQTIHEFRLLDDCQRAVSTLGSFGAEYIAQRLVKNTSPISNEWAILRRIAARLASPKEKPETFSTYVTLLCSRLAAQGLRYTIAAAFPPNGHRLTLEEVDDCNFEGGYDCNLLAAAAYLDEVSVVDQLTQDGKHANCYGGLLGSPIENAIERCNSRTLHLLDARSAEYSPLGESQVRTSGMALSLSLHGSTEMFEEYRLKWTPEMLDSSNKHHLRYFERIFRTPNIDIFNIALCVKKTTQAPDFLEWQLLAYLCHAARSGNEDMTRHLLSLGASVQGQHRRHLRNGTPLSNACKTGQHQVARILLEHGAEIQGNEVELAAKMGHWSTVFLLADHGSDVNSIDEPPIVSAITFEREDIFKELIKRGATLEGQVGAHALRIATEEGLESMLLLLRKHGVTSECGGEREC